MEWKAKRVWKSLSLYNNFLFFRKSFLIERLTEVESFACSIFADTRYQLFLNGQFIGRGPAPFDPRFARYDQYGAIENLREGENVIGVLVCYYGNPTGDCIPYTGGGMVFQGDLRLRGGHTTSVSTDESWLCKPATCWFPPITRRSPWRSLIELYDARWYPEGWNEPGFDDSAWLPVDVRGSPVTGWVKGGSFSPREIGYLRFPTRQLDRARWVGRVEWQDEPANVIRYSLREYAPEIEVTATALLASPDTDLHLPVTAKEVPPGECTYLVFDFGKAVTGRLGFEVEAAAGTIIDLTVKEVALEQSFLFPVAHYNSWNRYVCRVGTQAWQVFDYDCYRYAQLAIHNSARPVVVRRVWCEEQRYPLDYRGRFSCSDPRVDRVWEAARYTIELTTEGVIVDVANREVGAWTGDCEPAKAAIYYLGGADPITATCLRNISYSQALSGRLMGEWPSGVNGERFEAGIMSVPGSFGTEFPHHVFQWISAIWRHTVFSGDRELLHDLFEPAFRYLEQWVAQFADGSGVLLRDRWDDMWDWVDWSGVAESMVPMNFFYYGALHDLHLAAETLGEEDARELLAQRLAMLRDGLFERYWSDEHLAFVDHFVVDEDGASKPFFSEHTLSLALRYGLVPLQYRTGVLDMLTSGDLPDASPLHKVQKYWALGENGRAAAILRELRDKWLAMRSIEATGTCQESWEFDPDGGTAHCHSAATAPVHVLMAYVLGVRPTRPGFEEFIVHPDPGDLTFARGVVPTPHGDVSVSWEISGEHLQLAVTPPEGFTLVEETSLGGRILRRYRRTVV